MFREMRRKKQSLPTEMCDEILQKGTSGVLAVCGEDGWPYAVPLSYVHDGQALYFHCATTGHKLDAIAQNERASFCVIDADDVVPQEFTTYFRSVVVFGKVRILEHAEEKRRALEALGRRYSPGIEAALAKEIEGSFARVCVVKLTIEKITGKEAMELTRRRNA